MGADRAGWYSWDRIDNGGRPSARWIMSELQQLAPGQVLPAVPGERKAFVVVSVEPPRDIVLTVPGERGSVVVIWEHLLESADGNRTRMLVRGRVSRAWKALARRAGDSTSRPSVIERVYRLLWRMPDPVLLLLAGFGHRVMEARHMRGIKGRAEEGEDPATVLEDFAQAFQRARRDYWPSSSVPIRATVTSGDASHVAMLS